MSMCKYLIALHLHSIIDEKLLRIFLKILDPLMPYVECISAEEHSKGSEVEKETSGGVNGKGDNSTSDEQSAASVDNKSSQENIEISGEVKPQTSDDTVDEENSDEISEKIKRHIMMLYRILQGFAYDVMFSIHMVSIKLRRFLLCSSWKSFMNNISFSCLKCILVYLQM